jgi:hypothetical protein
MTTNNGPGVIGDQPFVSLTLINISNHVLRSGWIDMGYERGHLHGNGPRPWTPLPLVKKKKRRLRTSARATARHEFGRESDKKGVRYGSEGSRGGDIGREI